MLNIVSIDFIANLILLFFNFKLEPKKVKKI